MNLGFVFQLSHFHFFLLCLSTILIAAAGYIINDYFDTRIDAFNKPNKVLVGHSISRRKAMLLHSILNVVGVILGFYVGYKVGVIKLGLIHVISTGLLWFYSTDFKKQFLIGNLIVALQTALVPFIVVLYEIPPLISKYRTVLIESDSNFNHIVMFVSLYAGFAFYTTFIREIVKDMEDIAGDEKFGCRTLPIVYGITNTKKVIFFLTALEMLFLTAIQVRQLFSFDIASFIYFFVCFQIGFLIFLYQVKKSTEPVHFHKASRILKIIIMFGILYSAVYHYLLLY